MDRINEILIKPELTEASDLPLIKERMREYPFASNYRLLYLIALDKDNSPEFENELLKQSVYFNQPEYISKYFKTISETSQIKTKSEESFLNTNSAIENSTSTEPSEVSNETVSSFSGVKELPAFAKEERSEAELVANLRKVGMDHLIPIMYPDYVESSSVQAETETPEISETQSTQESLPETSEEADADNEVVFEEKTSDSPSENEILTESSNELSEIENQEKTSEETSIDSTLGLPSNLEEENISEEPVLTNEVEESSDGKEESAKDASQENSPLGLEEIEEEVTISDDLASNDLVALEETEDAPKNEGDIEKEEENEPIEVSDLNEQEEDEDLEFANAIDFPIMEDEDAPSVSNSINEVSTTQTPISQGVENRHEVEETHYLESEAVPTEAQERVQEAIEETEKIKEEVKIATGREASPAIEKTQEVLEPFNLQSKRTFNDWLGAYKGYQSPSVTATKSGKEEVIEKFIEKNPKITPVKSVPDEVIDINALVENDQEISHLMTETLAKLYVEQKKYNKAIEAYEILSLKNPEKSSIFADQIKELKLKVK